MKLIIETEIEPLIALEKLKSVIADGFVSKGRYGDQYCFASVWLDGVRVEADKTKNGTHTFRVWKK